MIKRFQVLDSSTEVLGRYFLEASAGTGKTFAIEHIAVRAILESEIPLSIDQILIVTFTRAATRELKNRLRSNLSSTLHFLQSKIAEPDYLRPIFARGDAFVFSAIRKMEEALYNFDKAQIFTLHGFCHKMLSEYAFEAGTFFEMSPPESSSHSQKLLQVVEDFFRAGLDREKYSPSQIDGVLKGSSRGMEGLCRKMVGWIEKSLSIPSSPGFTDTLLQAEKILIQQQETYPTSAEDLMHDFDLLAPCYKRIQAEHREQALLLSVLLKNKKISYQEWDHILGCKDFFLSLFSDDNLKKGKDPRKLPLMAASIFRELKGQLLPLIELGSHSDKNFLRLVDDCMEKWKKSSFFEESFAPDDLLKKMSEAIKKPELKDKISEKYRVAIIDEFQDTDPLQWEIFKSLFLSETSTAQAIYLVGDPKQSIYGFRNADVYTYLLAMKTLGEDNKLVLDTNFRSEPSLVKALNMVFTLDVAKDWMQMPSTGEFLDVIPVKAKAPFAEEEEKKERGSVHFFVAEGFSGRGKKWPSEEIEEDQLFPFIVSEIQHAIAEEGASFGQFAILVRDRYQAARLESFLKKWSVPCAVRKSFSLEESIAYLALHDVIRAVISPDDVGCLKKALGGAFIGMNARSLAGGMELALLQKARLYFNTARALVTKKGWGAFFTSFLASSWRGEISVLEDILSREDKSLYFEMRQLTQILLQGAQENLYSLEGFYAFFKQLATFRDDDELLKAAPESEEDQVIVMTIHASKGLEFDRVFALGLVSRSSGQEELLRTKIEGKESLETWDLSNAACIQSILETDAEKMRQLYVALTRAKTRVYVPVAIDLDKKPVKLSQASAIDLLCQSFGKEKFDLLSCYPAISEYSVEKLVSHLLKLSEQASIGFTLLAEEKPSLQVFSRESSLPELYFDEPFSMIFPSKKILSFTALHHAEQEEIDPLERMTLSSEKKENLLPLGASTGTFLHRIFELVIKQSFHMPYEEDTILQMISQQTPAHALQGWEEDISSIVRKVMHAPLLFSEEDFCFANIPAKDFFLEMEFAFEFEGHLMKGFIDGVFFWKNKYYLVDWKSNYLGDEKSHYSQDSLQQAMQEQGYFLQAAIYTEALKRYLALVEKRSFESCFGGAFYVFLRESAPYHFIPDLSLLKKVHAKGQAIWSE